MSSGTKIILAVAAMMVGALALYYGLMPRAAVQPAPGAGVAVHGAPAVEDPLAAMAVGGKVPTAPTNPPPRDGAATPARSPATAAPVGQRAASPPIAASGTGAVKPAPGAAAKKPVDYIRYVVRTGDTMSSIAETWFGDPVKWDLIARANPLADPGRLEVGQELRLPPRDAKRAEITPQGQAVPTHYTVRSGDTLSSIAKAVYGDPDQWWLIYESNRVTIGEDPHTLEAGMQLRMPRKK